MRSGFSSPISKAWTLPDTASAQARASLRRAKVERFMGVVSPSLWSLWKTSRQGREAELVGAVTHDCGALHLSVAWRVIHDRVVLRGAVVPEGHAVGPPAPTHLVFGNERLAHEIREQLGGAG